MTGCLAGKAVLATWAVHGIERADAGRIAAEGIRLVADVAAAQAGRNLTSGSREAAARSGRVIGVNADDRGLVSANRARS